MGGQRARAFLRRNPGYRAAWRAVFEAAPFPVRTRSQADRKALAWGLLACEDLHVPGGHPSSPFWVEAPMFEGEWATGPPPLPERLARSRARIEGLRLADGTLILKFENGSEAAQMRIRPGPDAEMGTGPVRRLGQSLALARLHDAWRPAGVPGPHPQRGPRGAPALRREPDQVQRPACAAREVSMRHTHSR